MLVKETFSLNLRVIQILGLYPPQSYQILYKIYAYTMYIFIVAPTPILILLYLLLTEDVNLSLVAQNAFAVAETGCFAFKLLQFISNGKKIKECIFLIESKLFSSYDKNQDYIVDECNAICRRNTVFFLFFVVLTCSSWAVVPLFGTEYILPQDIWLPFDTSSGGLLYVLSYIHLVFSVTFDAIATGAIDPLIGGLAFCAATQIRLLKDNLEKSSEAANLAEQSTSLKNDEIKSKLIYEKLSFCVDHHNAILRFVECFEDTFSATVFVQFSSSVLVICISCLQISMVELFTPDFFAMIIFINGVLLQIWFYCFYGTILYEESDTISTSAYMSKWYNYNSENKKLLLILMERCKRPMRVTSGKILDLSLETFTMILRRSYSLLAVLNNFKNT